jgi:hypothetical protein
MLLNLDDMSGSNGDEYENNGPGNGGKKHVRSVNQNP